MKLQVLAIFALVALVAGRAQNDNPQNLEVAPVAPEATENTFNFFPAPNPNETTTDGTAIVNGEEDTSGGVESFDGQSSTEVGSVETFGGHFPPPIDTNHGSDPWRCICDNGKIKFEDVHGGICKCDSQLRSVCDAKFKVVKEKCSRKSGLTCRTKEMNDECAKAIRCYFKRNCCSDPIDVLLAQSRASLRWYGCGFCKDWDFCGSDPHNSKEDNKPKEKKEDSKEKKGDSKEKKEDSKEKKGH